MHLKSSQKLAHPWARRMESSQKSSLISSQKNLGLMGRALLKRDCMNNHGNFLLYTTQNGAVKVDVFFHGKTVRLTQKASPKLFGVQVPAIAKYPKNKMESGELSRKSVISKMEITELDQAILTTQEAA